ncbi:MAG: hypothetical protein KGJ06_01165, partial [Pseudomonadota bacterium]|nr:hypothetical protein [Pseudomonadota bacterium]
HGIDSIWQTVMADPDAKSLFDFLDGMAKKISDAFRASIYSGDEATFEELHKTMENILGRMGFPKAQIDMLTEFAQYGINGFFSNCNIVKGESGAGLLEKLRRYAASEKYRHLKKMWEREEQELAQWQIPYQASDAHELHKIDREGGFSWQERIEPPAKDYRIR